MKIRNGFVSNSSTTSFCIYGAKIVPSGDINDEYDYANLMYDKCRKVGLDYISDPWCCGGWAGVSWSNIDNDETGAQFKARVEGKLFQLGIKPEKCTTYEEAWRDG